MRHTVLIDGYNVLHRVPAWSEQLERSLERARESLLVYCSAWRQRHRDVDRVVVVFDGDSSVADGRTGSAPGVLALYTESGETADRRIMSLLAEARRGEQLTVVTDDNEIRRRARAELARWLSVDAFMAAPRGARKAGGLAPDPGQDKARLPPGAVAAIDAELRRLWGIEP